MEKPIMPRQPGMDHSLLLIRYTSRYIRINKLSGGREKKQTASNIDSRTLRMPSSAPQLDTNFSISRPLSATPSETHLFFSTEKKGSKQTHTLVRMQPIALFPFSLSLSLSTCPPNHGSPSSRKYLPYKCLIKEREIPSPPSPPTYLSTPKYARVPMSMLHKNRIPHGKPRHCFSSPSPLLLLKPPSTSVLLPHAVIRYLGGFSNKKDGKKVTNNNNTLPINAVSAPVFAESSQRRKEYDI
ncbi:hypothetical protein QBC35DRAFT_243815 [Podospora australis]|uniref:Uncharacterized protein n=1 Tax=Podospora australis TaxID=1536484 RepID=A0AAN6X1Q8_9PEZI|nr:hypothetical protein QBC35DRAFT_243815 [Podospora australis]